MSFGSALTWMLDRLWSSVPPVSSTAGASPVNTSGTSISISVVRLTRRKSTWMAPPLSGLRWTLLMMPLAVALVPGRRMLTTDVRPAWR